MKKRAIVTGITGQDGFYLAEFLVDKEYERPREVDPVIGHPSKGRDARLDGPHHSHRACANHGRSGSNGKAVG